jgi:hypothetical protein
LRHHKEEGAMRRMAFREDPDYEGHSMSGDDPEGEGGDINDPDALDPKGGPE